MIPAATLIVSPAYSAPSVVISGKCMSSKTALGQALDSRRRGPDEGAADARFLETEAVPCEVDNVGIATCAHAPGHAAKNGLGHGIGGLESGVVLQRNLAAAVGASHA
jgi:hypothetical protein